jgi:hypothetical protein
MDLERPESQSQALPSTQVDAAALVERMVAAGRWPEPELLEQIVRAGDATVESLIAVLRTYPRGWPEAAPFDTAIGLLSMIRPPRAIPELIEIIRRYGNPRDDLGEAAARALGHFGPSALEPLLQVCRDPAVTGTRRGNAIQAAKVAAGSDPGLRARLADIIRPYLAEAIERAREEIRLARMKCDRKEHDEQADDFDEDDFAEGEEDADDDRAEEGSSAAAALGGPGTSELARVRHEDPGEISRGAGFSQDESESQLNRGEEIACLAGDLADLADPAARELIKMALDEELVDTFMIDESWVDARYRAGGEICGPGGDWLSTHREAYQKHLDYLSWARART